MNNIYSLQPVFDNIICLTLDGQIERQSSAKNQLHKIGVNDFDYIYGVRPKTEEFDRLRKKFSVAIFPPCFRCGQTNCNCENNFLTEAQIAVFFSYIKIWKKLASLDSKLALIVEDDVVFSKMTPKKLTSVINSCNNIINTTLAEPVLIRFGWARTKEHGLSQCPKFFENLIKMSNPCHAMNSGMAQFLLKKLDRIDTTSDIYLHSIIGPQVKNYTIFPPIASDLSWSNGVFQSLIHPKTNHIKQLQLKYFLTSFTNKNKAKKIKNKIENLHKEKNNHVKKVEQFEFCIIGHPRCGSAYMASLFQSFGCNVGHEQTFSHGISSWMFVADDTEYPFAFSPHAQSRFFCRFKYYILHLRNLSTAVSSVCLENTVPKSYHFRQHHINKELGIDLDLFPNRLEKAIVSICSWTIIAEKLNPDLILKIEDNPALLQSFLYEKGYIKSGSVYELPKKNINTNKKFNGINIKKPIISKSEWRVALSNLEVYKMAKEYCIRYGYNFNEIKGINE